MKKITIEEVREMMGQGFHCSQVVFGYGAEKAGMDKALALKLSGGLGGGCFHGDICGAVSGAIAALGLVYGYSEPNSAAQNDILVAKVKEFEKRFADEKKSLICRELLGGYDMANPAESIKKHNIANPKECFKNCADYCKFACDILDDMM